MNSNSYAAARQLREKRGDSPSVLRQSSLVTRHRGQMIHSMTGYAASAREFPFGALSIELRSVNHRYLDLQFRLPDDLRAIEPVLRELLNEHALRSSVARRLGLDIGALAPADRRVDGVVEMVLDATQHFDAPLSAERLFG